MQPQAGLTVLLLAQGPRQGPPLLAQPPRPLALARAQPPLHARQPRIQIMGEEERWEWLAWDSLVMEWHRKSRA